MKAFTYTITGTSGVTGLNRTAIYNLLAKGELVAKKAGRRTLVTAASIQQYIDSLPVAAIGHSKSESDGNLPPPGRSRVNVNHGTTSRGES